MTTLYVQAPNLFQAGSGSIIGATSVTLTSLTDIYGNVLTMADFGSLIYCTAEPDTNNAEGFTGTGITANANGTYTITGVKTLLAKSPYTQTSGLIRNHAGGTRVVITDNVGFWDKFVGKDNTEVITGYITLPNGANRPVLLADTDTATANAVITFGQLSRQAIAGAANASTTVKGLVELATQAEVDARATTGGTAALLVPTPDTQRSTKLSDAVQDTGTQNTHVVTLTPVATTYATGMIVSFVSASTNTGTATINVNGLGAKSLFKGAGLTALAAGDVATSMMVLAEYNGTAFQMMNPSSLALNSNGSGASLTGITALKTTRLAGYTPASNTVENTVFTTTITGGLLSANGMIRVRTPITFTTTATAETWTIRLKYGGATIVSTTVSCPAVGGGSAIGSYGMLEGWILNNASVSAQNVGLYSTLASQFGASPANPVSPTTAHAADTTSAVDTTTNQTLALTVQRSNGGGGSGAFYQTIVETNYNA